MHAFIKGRGPWTVLMAIVVAVLAGQAAGTVLGVGAGVLVAVVVWFVYPLFSDDRATAPPYGPTLPPSLHERERKAAEGDPEYGPPR
jgi:uncharacterized protein (DUF58 family)